MASAQAFEAGIQLTGLHLHKIDETPFGIGGRFHYVFSRLAAADIELTRYPEYRSGNFGETAALAGIRFGRSFERVGIFAKGRPGVIHFGGEYFNLRLDRKTHFTLDAGAVLEYYPNQRTFLR